MSNDADTSTAEAGTTTADDACPGLRERKKRARRRALHVAAVHLTHELGLSGVTVERIAEEAGVSPRTFFNYFPTKEAAIIGSDPDRHAQLQAFLDSRPADEDPLVSLATATARQLAILVADRALWRARGDLFQRYPDLFAVFVGANAELEAGIVTDFSRRMGVDPETDPRPAMLVASVTGAARWTMRAARAAAEPQPDLVELFFEALALPEDVRAGIRAQVRAGQHPA